MSWSATSSPLAPALAAEKAGRPRATLIPHVYPVHEPGMPFFSFGAQPPRTPLGSAMWRAWLPVLTSGLRRGRREMNETRAAVGLRAVGSVPRGDQPRAGAGGDVPAARVSAAVAGACSRDRADGVRAAVSRRSSCPRETTPLVLVASSTAQDPELRLVRAALEALAEEPVRVVATTNRRRRVAARCSAERGRGRLALLLAADAAGGAGGVPRGARDGGAGAWGRRAGAVLPGGRGHGGELGAGGVGRRRADAAVAADGAGARCAGRRVAILADPRFRGRASEIAVWASQNDGADRGAELVEHIVG